MIEERRIGRPDSRNMGARVHSLILESDVTPMKFGLMLFAIMQGIGFATMPPCNLLVCRFLEEALPYHAWAALFLTYGTLKLWRTFDGKSRPFIAKIINGYGGFLFGGLALAVLVARWPYWGLAVPYFMFAIAAVWVFARTAIYPGRGFRGD